MARSGEQVSSFLQLALVETGSSIVVQGFKQVGVKLDCCLKFLDGRVRFIDDSDGRILGGAGDKVKVADLNGGNTFEKDYKTQAKAWLIFEGREELID